MPVSMERAMNKIMVGLAAVAVANPSSPRACPKKMELIRL